ncbi:inactive transglutaminase family protein [Candidatus Nitronereus thalassa]|uniref:Inactive transglutaminase family protein n=1 Tax=Candidatus Nitronereus thalassa TaxID=3020898 RepID=A0ABU3K5T9_9BACT|nr:inactive transglutaminase family protein [Candidatus Nitronereus thalassa]MDT7041741.1 inactive transglutaminase family protein [Candidatus Nitronereus thalassa]
MSKRHLFILVAFLTSMGIGAFAYKAIVLEFPLKPATTTTIWDIEVHVTFSGKKKPVKISLMIPRNTRRYSVVNENFISQSFGLTTNTDEANRQAVWSRRSVKGKQSLFYRGTVRRVVSVEDPTVTAFPPMPMPDWTGAKLEAATALLREIETKSADTPTLVSGLLTRIREVDSDPIIQGLVNPTATSEERLQVVTQVLALAKIPARVAHGIQLKETLNTAPIIHWIQIFDKGLWKSYDPATGTPEIPDDYFTWWRGTFPMMDVIGAENVEATILVAPNQEAAIQSAIVRSQLATPKLLEFSLFSLPLETQTVYRVLLMVPLGALLLVLLRNVIGLKTFGTFMPILIALAFRETQLLWGIILFTVIVTLGLGIRFYLEHLKLLLVPRLASLLILVVMLMAFLSILTHKLGIDHGLSIALFPMVILTMTIERMCIVWEERGPQEALQQGLGSLAVATLTYLTMSLPFLEHLLFVFPELLLIILAATLLLGRYSGLRLLELKRFKALAQETG